LLKGSDNKLKINRTIKQIDRMEKGLYINNLRQVGRYFMQNITSVKDEKCPFIESVSDAFFQFLYFKLIAKHASSKNC
jgi:hypothetical protein